MAGIARKGDMASGHGCFQPSEIITASPDVEVDGIPAARIGDAVAPHDCADCASHDRVIAQGSATVFVNGVPVARVGDAVDRGGAVTDGSATVVIDEG